MKLSTKGRYGLRALMDLTIYGSNSPIPLNVIAERQNISENYLEQVFSALRKSGIVNSVKGAQGGYSLAYPPSKIKVGDILRVLEGSLSLADDCTENSRSIYAEFKVTLKVMLWDRINENINLFVDGITLEDLVNDFKQNKQKDFVSIG